MLTQPLLWMTGFWMLYYSNSLCYPFTTLYFFASWCRYTFYMELFFALCEQLQHVALNCGVYKPPLWILECFLTALLSGPEELNRPPETVPVSPGTHISAQAPRFSLVPGIWLLRPVLQNHISSLLSHPMPWSHLAPRPHLCHSAASIFST